MTSESIVHSHEADEKHVDAMNWDELEFGVIPTDYMYIRICSDGENFSQGHLAPYRKIELSPFAGILNYGQGILEGLKAIRTKDGRIQLFRPEENALRMKMGAERLCVPCLSTEQFLAALKQAVLANKRCVPPPGKGSLYIRPLLMGSGAVLGIGPAPECTFLIFTSPIGNWYKCGPSMNLYVENEVPRATPGGTGAIKSITNYSPVFEAVNKAKAKGFTDVLFLDAATGKNVEEVSSCNVFIVKDNVILTPPTNGTILPGVTRKSIIEIALHLKYKVEERDVPLMDVLTADEVFCTGTAVGVTAVASVTLHDKRVEYRTGEKSISQKLRVMLTEIQTGVVEDKMGWTMQIR
ncbi:putative branched-chain-amino-acid aminotransferase 7 [Pyrus x bretschneideri]|uniref:putative branched-chain-amino-acid aminotransferase 7 n=1 Tax=Pyrus x bretschneideri TaxID=225117 RepID=UPI0020303497|nr:putative branched-chain-amino-acid aminotransferase 7 [Pyrus x bretschneideri]